MTCADTFVVYYTAEQEEYDRHARQARAAHRSNSISGISGSNSSRTRDRNQSGTTLLGYTPIPSVRQQRRSRARAGTDALAMGNDFADQLANELVRGTQPSNTRNNNSDTNGILHGTADQQREQLQQLIHMTAFDTSSPNNSLTRTSSSNTRGLRSLFGNMLATSTSQHNTMQSTSPHHHPHHYSRHYRPPVQSSKKPASILLVESLPTFRYKQSDGDVQQNESSDKEDVSCSICICEFEDNEILRLLPCIHRFHRDCIDKWLSINRLCPTCNLDGMCNIKCVY